MALKGIKVIELAGLAPVPMCGMILSDFGANVIRVDRPNADPLQEMVKFNRGKQMIQLDIKKPAGLDALKRLCNRADVLLDPYRPGTLEKFTLGPKDLHQSNPGLIIARLSGYGQTGPYSKMAGHDINYISMAGILSKLGTEGSKPTPPINLLADFGGGSIMCALGICLALLERHKSNKGQVVDANMVEGAAYAYSFLWKTQEQPAASFMWSGDRGKSILDGGAHFYTTYETKDGKYMSVGSLEPKFYSSLIQGLSLSEEDYPQLEDWEKNTKVFTEIFKTKTRAEWTEIFEPLDCCVTPVLTMEEAAKHPHNAARKSFISEQGSLYPRPAPVLSRTPAEPMPIEPESGQDTIKVLQELDFSEKEIDDIVGSQRSKL